MKILITGVAGFIGFHLAKALLERGDEVIGLDNMSGNDINLMQIRLSKMGISAYSLKYGIMLRSHNYGRYRFTLQDITDRTALEYLFAQEGFDLVCHLAAKTGVRRSLECPDEFIRSNVEGFVHILECCCRFRVQHLLYASSSSVYGTNTVQPYAVCHPTENPVSMYAATKKMNELMAHTYSHLFRLPTTGLRFFSVYGPYGRPDMAPFLFTKAITEEVDIKVYNNGNMSRDFTYVDDIVRSIVLLIDAGITPENPYQLYNIGCGQPTGLLDLISILEKYLGKVAKKQFYPLQDGDMISTFADVSSLVEKISYHPQTSLDEGIRKFVEWYLCYQLNNKK